MKIIILAAGLGNRLGAITQKIPKAMIEIEKTPLILRVIRFARLIGPYQIIIVGGYKCGILWNFLNNENIIRVENPEHKKGNLYSLNCARSYLNEGFIQLNTDHLYPRRVAEFIRCMPNGLSMVSDFDRRLFDDDMKIKVNGKIGENALISAVSKKLNTFDGGYCGITIVKGKGINPYLSALDTVLERNDKQSVVEDVISELILNNSFPQILDISGIRWLEIDTSEDLENARRILRVKPNFLD